MNLEALRARFEQLRAIVDQLIEKAKNAGGGGEDTLRSLLTNTLTELVIYDAVSLAGFRVPTSCTKLLKFVAPNISDIDNYGLYGAAKLQYIDLGRISKLNHLGINGKHYIDVLILRGYEVVPLSGKITNSKCFNEGGFEGHYTYIYVPKVLIEDYKVATNWSNYANRFRAIEDYPEITGGVI
jgi:hypothetical protein